MDANIYFDHTYTMDREFGFLESLIKAGFTVHDKTTEHPDVECRFIMLADKKYLEFVHPKHEKNSFFSPGISFGYKTSLKALYDSLKPLEVLKASYTHRNYNWAENSTDYLPGWNYLNFGISAVKSFNPWFTEYETREGVSLEAPEHPNGISGVLGHTFELNQVGRAFFELVLKTKIKDKIVLNDGTTLFFRDSDNNRHSQVILGSSNMTKTMYYLGQGSNGEIAIKNPSSNENMWDLVIRENC
jgi:hypothetical protein